MVDSHGDAPAHELPPARVLAAPPSGLDHPGAGLVLGFVALGALPQTLGMIVQLLVLDREHWEPKVTVMLLTMFAVVATQLAAGLAIAWQSSARRQWFAGFLCVSIATLLVSIVWWPDELGKRAIVLLAIEVLSTPLLVLVGPRLFPIPSGPALAGLLIVGGSSLLLTQATQTFDHARGLVHIESLGIGLAGMVHLAIAVVIGVLAVRAGLRMSRGQPARRALGAYVIAAIASVVIFDAIAVVSWLVDGHLDNAWRYVLPSMVTGAIVAIARPLVIWRFAQRELAAPAPGGAGLPWLALWFVPELLARLLLYEELGQFGDVTRTLGLGLCVATAIAILGALRTGRRWWLAATFAGALLVVGLYAAHTMPDRFGTLGSTIVAPLATLFAALATAAWFARRVSSAE